MKQLESCEDPLLFEVSSYITARSLLKALFKQTYHEFSTNDLLSEFSIRDAEQLEDIARLVREYHERKSRSTYRVSTTPPSEYLIPLPTY